MHYEKQRMAFSVVLDVSKGSHVSLPNKKKNFKSAARFILPSNHISGGIEVSVVTYNVTFKPNQLPLTEISRAGTLFSLHFQPIEWFHFSLKGSQVQL